jgi:hypothetical protein
LIDILESKVSSLETELEVKVSEYESKLAIKVSELEAAKSEIETSKSSFE